LGLTDIGVTHRIGRLQNPAITIMVLCKWFIERS